MKNRSIKTNETTLICKQTYQATPPINLYQLNEMLEYVEAETDREQWLKTLMAIKSEFGGTAKAIANDWSATGSSFNQSAFNATWKSIKLSGGVTIATLIHQAKQNGYQFAAISVSERVKLDQQVKHRKEQQSKAQQLEDQAMLRQYQQASQQARHILVNATPAPSYHPYLISKGINAHGVLFGTVFSYQDALTIPLYGTNSEFSGKVQTLQFIQPDGEKRFLKGGKKIGGYYPIQWIDDAPIVICEGFATGATLAEHYSPFSSVICAFDAGNLLPVARWFKKKYPMQQIIIAGDNDHQDSNGNPTNINTGLTKAIESAKAVNGLASVPNFEEWEPGSDWNDRYHLDQQSRVLASCEDVLLEGDV